MSQQTTNRYFDELASGLASGSISRGKALRLMGAALVGGTLSSLGIGGVAAADDECKPLNKKCRKNHQCCSGNCAGSTCACQSNGGTCSAGSQCCSGNCSGGKCCLSNGGTCTSTSQCCGEGVCSNGECCLSNGSSCANGSECCSGLVCKGPSGQATCAVAGPGGSCIPPSAIVCDRLDPESCSGGPSGGCACLTDDSFSSFFAVCVDATEPLGSPCSTSCDCPAGQICYTGSGRCAVVASTCPVS